MTLHLDRWSHKPLAKKYAIALLAEDGEAWGINDNGQIVGQYAADGRNHGFLATPGG